MKKNRVLVVLLSFALFGCGAHPGAGIWQANEGNRGDFARLLVHFDGKAEFFFSDQPQKEWHCFWQAFNQDAIDLICSQPEQGSDNLKFRLFTVGDSRGELVQDGEVVGYFDRQPWE